MSPPTWVICLCDEMVYSQAKSEIKPVQLGSVQFLRSCVLQYCIPVLMGGTGISVRVYDYFTGSLIPADKLASEFMCGWEQASSIIANLLFTHK